MNRSFSPLRQSFLAALLATGSLPACSSSNAASPASSASPDTQFCDAVISSNNRCQASGDAGACKNAELADWSDKCAQVASTYSTAMKSAYTTCGPSLPCGAVDVLLTSCGETAARAALSAAQTKLASDYCAVCAGTAGLSLATCEGAFWGLDADAGTILAGIGYGALAYSDAIVGLVDTSCIPELDAGSQLGCIDPFAACIGATTATAVTSAFPAPTACAGASADGGGI